MISRENYRLLGWKTCENVVVMEFLTVDNFDFTRKIVKKNCWVKNSWKYCGFGLFTCWQLWFHEKNCQRKTRENVVVLDFLHVNNFDFTRKIVKKKFGWKCCGFVKIEFLDKNLTFRIVCIGLKVMWVWLLKWLSWPIPDLWYFFFSIPWEAFLYSVKSISRFLSMKPRRSFCRLTICRRPWKFKHF